ncbi:MAG: DUF2304 domain-containing protein [Bacteroidota bacterium]
MEIRLFQILIPTIGLLFVVTQIARQAKGKVTLRETILVAVFWIAVSAVAIFPDRISNFFAELLGIKDNVNAVLFLGIVTVLYFQFLLYNRYKGQQRQLTKLTRMIALRDAETEESKAS